MPVNLIIACIGFHVAEVMKSKQKYMKTKYIRDRNISMLAVSVSLSLFLSGRVDKGARRWDN